MDQQTLGKPTWLSNPKSSFNYQVSYYFHTKPNSAYTPCPTSSSPTLHPICQSCKCGKASRGSVLIVLVEGCSLPFTTGLVHFKSATKLENNNNHQFLEPHYFSRSFIVPQEQERTQERVVLASFVQHLKARRLIWFRPSWVSLLAQWMFKYY